MTTADDTRRRILDAATDEFAEHGIAGARVDRIAARSGMSKPMLYAYFGAKDRLFDAVFDDHVLGNGDRVPFTADDLPGYAARLYDDYVADPALMRLIMWKRLEREPHGFLYEGRESTDDDHVRAIAEQQRLGTVRDDVEAADAWALLLATAATWAQQSLIAVATELDHPALHARRRAALAATIRGGLCTMAQS
ncbi:TetR family transcriptional regulator [Agrococcus versicolor]|uniref:TetR family transcriptional regulator n=1 Tax=Agrococcus versicolor TaxID=501482 RepID=A0ABN3AJK7_9MICO